MSVWRSWRVVLLAWAVLLAPQFAHVHALSHIAFQQTAAPSKDTPQPAPETVCESCLAMAQFGAALPSQSAWLTQTSPSAPPQALVLRGIARRTARIFHARAPPPLS